jgi:hypothetical protein
MFERYIIPYSVFLLFTTDYMLMNKEEMRSLNPVLGVVTLVELKQFFGLVNIYICKRSSTLIVL